ncbi:MAG TPA: hypothetical protein VJU15_14030 [Gemmatimonadales bacterium]|nr:hypothetical protein [Gemmatimonadales bacterium]
MKRKRRRGFSLLSAFYVVVTLGIMVGGSVWLDDRGEIVTAKVAGKHEEVQVSDAPQGAWTRFYRVGVEFPAANDMLGQATVTVPLEQYDALHVGDSLRVRYLPAFPLLARTADRSTLTVVYELGSRFVHDPILLPLILWLIGGAVMLWVAMRVATTAVFVAGGVWVALGFVLMFPEPAPLRLGATEGTARVSALKLVTKSPSTRGRSRRRRRFNSDAVRRLAVPYQVVQLRLALPGSRDTVLVVDAVDSASLVGVAVGADLPVRYDPATPRDARLTIGARTFVERNRYHFRVSVIGVPILGTLGAWGWRSRRTKGEGT